MPPGLHQEELYEQHLGSFLSASAKGRYQRKVYE